MAISSPRDANRVPAMMVTLDTDGITPVNVQVDPSTHAVKITTSTSSVASSENAERDDNRIPVIWGVSSADGITPVAIYGTTSGQISVQNT